jgi:hypothetical protein
MDLEEILHNLEEAVELKDWDLVLESIDVLREKVHNPLDDYEEDW